MRTAGQLVIACFVAFAATACAQQTTQPTQPTKSDRERAPFTVGFTADGRPIVRSLDGKVLPPIEVRLPIRASAILKQYNFNAVEAEGSNYLLLCYAGVRCFCYNLPHPDGSLGNSCSQ